VSNDQKWWNDFWDRGETRITALGSSLDTWYDLVWHVTFEYWRELFGSVGAGKRMIECGCGSARVSQYMARLGYQCTLLDRSEEGLALARRNFSALSLSGNFVLADINRLCVRDEQFDVVYSGGVLEFLDDLKGPVQEMVRILKPGGVLAANVVPPKFSIQSIADIERTAVYSIRHLAQGRFGEAFKRVRQIPRDYQVQSWVLADYVRAFEAAGLQSVTGLVTTPFPALALPKTAQKVYARAMRGLLPQWRRFNTSGSRLNHLWGIGYAIHGIKG
jgi:ubiquinone/menaquinone biosynthesis C-methylase UbiE